MPFLASEGCFWPLTASMTAEAKHNYAYVITQDICNKFIEVNFCVSWPNFNIEHPLIINKITTGRPTLYLNFSIVDFCY